MAANTAQETTRFPWQTACVVTTVALVLVALVGLSFAPHPDAAAAALGHLLSTPAMLLLIGALLGERLLKPIRATLRVSPQLLHVVVKALKELDSPSKPTGDRPFSVETDS